LKDGGSTRKQEEEIKLLLEYIDKIKYGSITISIQDGRIVQIEKSEKIRLKN
jgi:hypothetical protein